MGTFSVGAGEYSVTGTVGELPTTYAAMLEHAILSDDLGIREQHGTPLVVAVGRSRESWPALIVSQRFSPGPSAGFHPGALLIPESDILYVGAGTRLLAYDLQRLLRLWTDQADTGFWQWKRHGDTVVMSAELELAAWDTLGRKLWTTFVEPPWSYEVRDRVVHLDVIGARSVFPLASGPGRGSVG